MDLNLVGSLASLIGIPLGLYAIYFAIKSTRESNKAFEKISSTTNNLTSSTSNLATLVDTLKSTVDSDLKSAVDEIKDSLRVQIDSYSDAVREIETFFRTSDNSDLLFVMADTISLGHILLADNKTYSNSLWTDQNSYENYLRLIELDIQKRIGDAREFYYTTVDEKHRQETFVEPIMNFVYDGKIDIHSNQSVKRFEDLFVSELNRIRTQKNQKTKPYNILPEIPFQLFLSASKDRKDYYAIIIFIGKYNIEQIRNVRGIVTRNRQFVEALISIFETMSGLDTSKNPNYIIWRDRN